MVGHPKGAQNDTKVYGAHQAGYITGQTLIVDGGQILPESLEALNQA